MFPDSFQKLSTSIFSLKIRPLGAEEPSESALEATPGHLRPFQKADDCVCFPNFLLPSVCVSRRMRLGVCVSRHLTHAPGKSRA